MSEQTSTIKEALHRVQESTEDEGANRSREVSEVSQAARTASERCERLENQCRDLLVVLTSVSVAST